MIRTVIIGTIMIIIFSCHDDSKNRRISLIKQNVIKPFILLNGVDSTFATDSSKIIDQFKFLYKGKIDTSEIELYLEKVDLKEHLFFANIVLKGKLIKLNGTLYGCKDKFSKYPNLVKNELGYEGLPSNWIIFKYIGDEREYYRDGFIYEFLKLENEDKRVKFFGRFVNNEIYYGNLKSPTDSVFFSFKLSKKISENGKY